MRAPRRRAGALAASLLALAAGCSVRADLGGNDGPDAAEAVDGTKDEVAAAVELQPEPPPVDAGPPEPPADATAADSSDVAAAESRPDAGVEALPLTCDDNLLDGDETDVDCGGSCAPCGLGQRCHVSAECGTWPGCDPVLGCACDEVTQACVYDHCADERQDEGETAVDCGGGECAGCGPQKPCVLDSDCSRTLPGCDPTHGGCTCDVPSRTCVYSHCYDHKSNADETGVDCGGSCTPCALGVACQYDGDCASNACDAMSGACVSNQCADHRLDGDETDVDCGGGTCLACALGKKCKYNSDCQTSFCTTGTPHLCD
jgi:hypothetical protein